MSSADVAWAVWAALGAVVAVGQLVAARSRGHRPGLGAVAELLAAHPATRVVVVLGWMWLGWHAFAR